MFEYIEQLDTALHEVQRVLHPGGRCAILATDWSTAAWHSRHPGGAVAAGRSGAAPADAGVPLNRSYHGHSFSYWVARMIRAFVVGWQAVTAAEAEAWLQKFDALEQQGAYFLCLTSILTEAVKVV